MNDMPNSAPLSRPLSDAIEIIVQERVIAALATEKDNRVALMARVEGDAFQRGYAEALSDVEAAWGGMMQRLWAKRAGGPVVALAPHQWPYGSDPMWSEEDLAKIRAARPGAVLPFCRTDASGAGLEGPTYRLSTPPEPKPAATATQNLYGWPEPVLDILRRQWPRYVTEREIQNQVEAVLLETTPSWKLRAEAKAMGLVRPDMPRLNRNAKLVEVTWHQAAMLARGYSLTFTGDMQPLNKARLADSRLPCRLTQPDGPTVADVDKYGPATL